MFLHCKVLQMITLNNYMTYPENFRIEKKISKFPNYKFMSEICFRFCQFLRVEKVQISTMNSCDILLSSISIALVDRYMYYCKNH